MYYITLVLKNQVFFSIFLKYFLFPAIFFHIAKKP